ncbi:MAG TPA: TonB-dependent receptor [Williamwhitmania sp.]|nr:TonB-dependent receptor [Williamwhitmania sp.]
MLKKHALLLFLFLILMVRVSAQGKATVSGTIKDRATGETLIGVNISIQGLSGIGVISNEYGFYSLTLPSGRYNLYFSYVGYKTDTVAVNLSASQMVNVSLVSGSKQLQEIVVSAVRKNENIRSAQSGIERIDPKEVSNIPVLFGEKDIVKTFQLLPGVQSASEGSSGFYVRGGSSDQNLILLDEAPVYNASHLLGFFSTFNSDAVKDAVLYKGTQPAQYGGRLASVLDIKMNDGNDKHYSVGGGIGLVSSKLNIEGPIIKNRASFLITARRTYADLFLKLSNKSSLRNSKLYFYDLNAKLNFKISDKDRLYFSGYLGRDVLGVNNTFGIDWGNYTATLRWNHIMNDKFFSNTSLLTSKYDYRVRITNSTQDITLLSSIKDYNLKQEFSYFASPSLTIKTGFNSIYHTIVPGKLEASSSSSVKDNSLQDRYSLENALFLTGDWKISSRLNLNGGLRATGFSILGSGDFYTLDANRNILDTTSYKSGQMVKTYFNLEPRFTASYTFTPSTSIKASVTRNVQNLHLLSNSTSTNPTDKWVASDNIIKPEISDQVSFGVFKNFAENQYEVSVETYYKRMQNQIDYIDGADLQSSNNAIETELLFGRGRAYGVEFLAKKKYGRFTGWVGYTLSRTEKQINGINSDKWYPATQDRTHDVSVVLMFNASARWSFSATWVYFTGNAVSFPSGKYYINNQVVFYYTERNGYRMPAYHRLDLGATWKLRDTKTYSSELAFSLYNAYGRENAYSINFQQSDTDPEKTVAVQTTLFRFVPSISWNFKFK